MSGNLERYSLEIMHESKRIFLVRTPEIPSLHLAKEKYLYLKHLDLGERVSVLLNRCQVVADICCSRSSNCWGFLIYMTFPNDYQGVQRAMTACRWVDSSSELGRQFTAASRCSKATARPSPTTSDRSSFSACACAAQLARISRRAAVAAPACAARSPSSR